MLVSTLNITTPYLLTLKEDSMSIRLTVSEISRLRTETGITFLFIGFLTPLELLVFKKKNVTYASHTHYLNNRFLELIFYQKK